MIKFLLLHDIMAANRNIDDRGITFIEDVEQETFVSYSQLYGQALRVLKALQNRGVQPGDELLFQIDDNKLFVEVFWACVLGGIIAVPVAIGSNDETKRKVYNVWRRLNRPYLICSGKVLDNLIRFTGVMPEFQLQAEEMEARYLNTAHMSSMDEAIPGQPSPDDIAFIQFSSGSTGDPKGVVLTHGNLMANICALHKVWPTNSCERVLSWMPLTHDMGLIAMHILHAYTQASQYIMRTKLFILNPVVWIEKAHRHKINKLFSPNFGFKYFLAFYQDEHDYEWDLSGVDQICNGAEPISIELCGKFMKKLAKYGLKSDAMKAVYGLAEGTVGVSVTPINEPLRFITLERKAIRVGQKVRYLNEGDRNGLNFADVGFPIESCSVRISDSEGNALEDNTVGYILIHGPSVTKGYYNDAESTERTIGRLGWLKTGDLGFMQEGRLVVVGREKEILFVNGQNVFFHDIERVAEEVEGVELWNVAAAGVRHPAKAEEEAILFLRYRGKDLTAFCELADRVQLHVHAQMGISIDHVVPVKSIPKTTSGKIQRYKLGQQYAEGRFEALIREVEVIRREQNTPINTQQKLSRICRNILGRELGLHDHFHESGGNSLILTQVTEELSTQYGIRLNVAELYKYPTIAKLSEYIDQGVPLSLPSVAFPEEYFAAAGGQTAVAEYEATIVKEVYEGLGELAKEANSVVRDVLLSAFLYLLKGVSGENLISVLTCSGEEHLLSIEMDFEQVDTVDNLVRLVRLQSEAAYERVVPNHLTIPGNVPEAEPNRITAHFIHRSLLSPRRQWHGLFDLTLAYIEGTNRMDLHLEYNRKRLDPRKMKVFLAQYVALLADFVKTRDHASV